MKQLISDLIGSGYLKTAVIIDAFMNIDRKNFLPENMIDRAEEDIPLPIGFGQTISQPLTVAFMLELLKPETNDKVMDIGSGSGWTAALLSYIVGKQGKVIALERIRELKTLGEKNVDKYSFIRKGIAEFYETNGSYGFTQKAPYDKILVSAAAEKIPETLMEQLKVGGRLVIPVKNSIKQIKKISEDKYKEQEFFGFSFVPLVSR